MYTCGGAAEEGCFGLQFLNQAMHWVFLVPVDATQTTSRTTGGGGTDVFEEYGKVLYHLQVAPNLQNVPGNDYRYSTSTVELAESRGPVSVRVHVQQAVSTMGHVCRGEGVSDGGIT